MKLLFASANPPEVGLLKSMLDEAGIASEIRNESSYPNFPGASFQPELWVLNDADFPAASELREACQFSASTDDTPPSDGSQTATAGDAVVSGSGALVFLALGVIGVIHLQRAGDLRRSIAVGFLCGLVGLAMAWRAACQWKLARKAK